MALLLNDITDLWRPSTVFGLSIHEDDVLTPLLQRKLRRQLGSNPYGPRHMLRHKSLESDHVHSVTEDKSKFQASLDVSQFHPDEISVKASGEDILTIEAKHEDREDDHGWISRHFVRKYKVPKGHDLSKCTSKLSSDGILTVTAPKKVTDKKNEIEIPITFTNIPSINGEKAGEKPATKDVGLQNNSEEEAAKKK